jgi:hypothetical protein
MRLIVPPKERIRRLRAKETEEGLPDEVDWLEYPGYLRRRIRESRGFKERKPRSEATMVEWLKDAGSEGWF